MLVTVNLVWKIANFELKFILLESDCLQILLLTSEFHFKFFICSDQII